MKRMTAVMIAFIALFCAFNTQAKESLNADQIARVKALKASIGDVEKKTLSQMIDQIQNTPYPQMNLTIKEAMAHAYLDIVQEQNVQGQSKKEWLYSMVALNMAYFQFGGDKVPAGKASNINKLIRSKLKKYLPSEIYKQTGFYSSIG